MSQTPAQQAEMLFDSTTGKPFVSQNDARVEFERRKLNPERWEILISKNEGGWVIARPDAAARIRALESKPDETGNHADDWIDPDKVYWVKFNPKSNPEDTDDVFLGINNDQILIQRDKRIPLKGYFVRMAMQTISPIYVQIPGESRKIISWICTYPPTVMGVATDADWLRYRPKLNKAGHEKESGL